MAMVRAFSNVSLPVTILFLVALCGCALPKSGTKAKNGASPAPGTGLSLSGKLRESPATPKVQAPPPASGTTAAAVTSVAIAAPPDAAVTTPAPAGTAGSGAPYRIRVGDPIIVVLRDLPGREKEQQVEQMIDDQGTVNLPLIGRVVAAGKTTSALEQEIQHEYVEVKKLYRQITINVIVPQRFIFVGGEVKLANRYPLVAGMTLLQAIANAGGHTDFADLKKVQLIRGDTTTVHNILDYQKNPSKDVPLEAGDQVNVPRSWY